MNREKICKRLKELRGYKPQRIVADELGIAQSTYASYEMGQRIPKDDIKIRIAEYFKTTVQALFYD